MEDVYLMAQLAVNACIATASGGFLVVEGINKKNLLKYVIFPFIPVGLWLYFSESGTVSKKIGAALIFFAVYLGIVFFNILFGYAKKIDEKMAKENRVWTFRNFFRKLKKNS